jgi:RNA polymerase sporulation-specific sigma factor
LTELNDNELAKAFQDGNEEALEILFHRYKTFLEYVANQYYIKGADGDDLVSEGMFALWNAAKSYDESKGASFKTYANTLIQRSMINAVRDANTKKNEPLNSSTSLEDEFTDNEGKKEVRRVKEVLYAEKQSNPESILLDKENAKNLEGKIFDSLSQLEKQILQLYMQGNDYHKIAQMMNKSDKQVDNALQRIRKKAASRLKDA